jgi:hypothetical protein
MKLRIMKGFPATGEASAAHRAPRALNAASLIGAAALTAFILVPLGARFAVAARSDAKSHSMTPEVKLVDDYNTWFLGGAYWDIDKLKAGLPQYITKETVLHEPVSLPWGGTMVGYDGWVRLSQKGAPVLEKLSSLMEMSNPKYYQRGNVVIHEITLTIKPTKAAPEPFVIGLMEKYTIENGRIKQIDEFWADTASFLDRLALLGALPDHQK